jgi:hypothetical protein
MNPIQPIPSEISPELVLVDPELRSRAQLRLPEPGAFWEFRSRPPPSIALARRDASEGPARVSVDRDRRHDGRLGKALLLSVIVASLTANALVIASRWHSADCASTVSPTKVPAALSAAPTTASPVEPTTTTRDVAQKRPHSSAPATAQQSDAAGSAQRAASTIVIRRTDTARPSLSWHPVVGASYYNLVVWRGHRRILDMWPTSTHVPLPRTWKYDGVRGSLSPGRYLWFAYPGLGTRASARFGTPVQSGVLIVSGTS